MSKVHPQDVQPQYNEKQGPPPDWQGQQQFGTGPSAPPPQGAPYGQQGPYPGQAPPGPYPGQAPPGPYPGPTQPGPYPGQAPPGPYPGPAQPGPYPGQAPPGPFPGPGQPPQLGAIAPPSYEDTVKGAPPPRPDIANVPVITEDEARTALANFLQEHCCYGKKPLKELFFIDLKSSNGYHYTLETFTESRSVEEVHEPFIGQQIDGPHNGRAPAPWSIDIKPTSIFTNNKFHMEIPHTATLKGCHTCYATGRVRCLNCNGSGRDECYSCGGSGFKTDYHDGKSYRRSCSICAGTGTVSCSTCNSTGMVKCKTCEGRAQLKWFQKLTVTWKNHVLENLVEKNTNLPNDKLKSVSGSLMLDETENMVHPIKHCPEPEVNNASHALIQEHIKMKNHKILKQRHRLRVIPVTRCIYKWKESSSDYVVYGFEHHVHAPNYPQKCCWGCTIL